MNREAATTPAMRAESRTKTLSRVTDHASSSEQDIKATRTYDRTGGVAPVSTGLSARSP